MVLEYSNRAWCYSKLELNKHVIKDCDKAIALNPSILQAYLYKGAKSVRHTCSCHG